MGRKSILALFLILALLFGCQEFENEASIKNPYAFTSPLHFPDPVYTFRNNPVTEEGFKLGRTLFFDPALSRDGSVACANCHVQSHAFADVPLHPFSFGVEDREGKRNSPPLFNLAFQRDFFWDGGVAHLDFVPIAAIESEIEMDESFENLVRRLNRHPLYPARFKKAFDIDEITGPFVLHAFSQFMVNMVSANSKYDKYILGDQNALNSFELEGLSLFRQHCESCHKEPLFTDLSFRNNGVQKEIRDKGRMLITEMPQDMGKFKVPSLRNIEVTSPYMHNASMETLTQVLDHYASGIHNQPTLDLQLMVDGKPGIKIDEQEKEKIIAFLKTLTDPSFLNNPIFFNRND